jgi:hypothetical protein
MAMASISPNACPKIASTPTPCTIDVKASAVCSPTIPMSSPVCSRSHSPHSSNCRSNSGRPSTNDRSCEASTGTSNQAAPPRLPKTRRPTATASQVRLSENFWTNGFSATARIAAA